MLLNGNKKDAHQPDYVYSLVITKVSCCLEGMLSYETRRQKTCLRGVVNNTGTDLPAHPRSLISAFVIRFLECTIGKPATGEILIF